MSKVQPDTTTAVTKQSVDTIPDARRAEYLKLLELHNTNRIDYNVRKWETLKYFQSVILALLGATAVAFSTGIDRGLFCKPLILSIGFFGIVIALPLVATFAAALGIANLRRESELLYIEEAQSFKIAKLLDLDVSVSANKRWLPSDEHLLTRKWRDWSFGVDSATPPVDLDTWISLRLKKHLFKTYSDLLFQCEIFVSVSAIVLAIVIFIAAYWAPAAFGARICTVALPAAIAAPNVFP
jgi:hypothetical protein